jgi:hypothetical protein
MMASGSNKRSDELEGKLSERSLKRRMRSDRRRKGPAFESLGSDQGRRRRSRRGFDDDRSTKSLSRDWRDVSPDLDPEDQEDYDLDSDDTPDPDFDMRLTDLDIDDSDDDQWSNDWR